MQQSGREPSQHTALPLRMAREHRMLATEFLSGLHRYVKALDSAPEGRLELHLTSTDDTLVQVAMSLDRFDALLHLAEIFEECGTFSTPWEFQHELKAQSPIVIIEPGQYIFLPEKSPAGILVPPSLYAVLHRLLLDALSGVNGRAPRLPVAGRPA